MTISRLYLIAARETDSINAVSKRSGISFGWTRKWVKELAKIGVMRSGRMEVKVNTGNPVYKETMAYREMR